MVGRHGLIITVGGGWQARERAQVSSAFAQTLSTGATAEVDDGETGSDLQSSNIIVSCNILVIP